MVDILNTISKNSEKQKLFYAKSMASCKLQTGTKHHDMYYCTDRYMSCMKMKL